MMILEKNLNDWQRLVNSLSTALVSDHTQNMSGFDAVIIQQEFIME
jgi:hypothetical protein